ncbi:MAG: aminotransferase class V-fold PLP-dependent enzyme [Bacteroidota bacterium]
MPDPIQPLACQRDLFSLPDHVHYLNCASRSPLAHPVEDAGIAGLRSKRVPLLTHDDFFGLPDRIRAQFAKLINTSAPQQIALIPAVSYGMAIVAKNTPLAAGQRIVLVDRQFPSDVYAFRRLAAESGASITTVHAPDAKHQGQAWSEALIDALTPDAGLIVVPHVHWTDGTTFDLEAIGRRARDVGAAFVVDGTQSVGALPFDAALIQPDALVCAGYKWLFGPYTSGVAYFGERYLDGIPLEENWISRAESDNFSQLVQYQDAYQPGAIRYDMGERSNFIQLPMLHAALDLVLRWRPERVQAYCQQLTAPLLADIRALGYHTADEPSRAHHIFGVRMPPEVPLDRLKAALTERHIHVSVRGDAVRVAPHVYNTETDVSALRDALAAVKVTPHVTSHA